MDFIVRIFFVGLMAFVPSQDGKEITVLLLDAAQGYTVSDGSRIPPHEPLLLARSGGCGGNCGADPGAASFLFPDLAEDAARDALAQAVDAGFAWRLDGSDLALFGSGRSELAASPLAILGNQRAAGEPLPRSAAERKDFGWVAELEKIAPSAGAVDPDVLLARPQKGLIAARLRLRAGEISSYRLVSLTNEVPPLGFRSLQSASPGDGYRQALTDWVAAEIRVRGDVLELSESRWDGGEGRAAALRPAGDTLELALLNVPAGHAAHAAEAQSSSSAPGPGKHFEMYYEIANMRPPNRLRPVPVIAGNERVDWTVVHRDELSSRLLEAIRLSDPRGSYEPVICPVARLTAVSHQTSTTSPGVAARDAAQGLGRAEGGAGGVPGNDQREVALRRGLRHDRELEEVGSPRSGSIASRITSGSRRPLGASRSIGGGSHELRKN